MSKRENLKKYVQNFIDKKEDYKAEDGTFSNTAPDTNNFTDIGEHVYENKRVAYEAPESDYKKSLEEKGLETPETYKDFLEQGNESALEEHNLYIDKVATQLQGILDEPRCKQANIEYEAAVGGAAVDFCSGKVTTDQLKALIDVYSEQQTAVASATQEQSEISTFDKIFRADDASQQYNDAIDRIEDTKKSFSDSLAIGRFSEIKFAEQCFLLTHAKKFADFKLALDEKGLEIEGTTVYNKTLPYNGSPTFTDGHNSSILAHYDPYSFMNRLTQSGNKAYLFDIPTSALSALQPMIRLYKVVVENGKEKEVEIKFDSHYSQTDVQDLLANKNVRGHGVGIKSFDVSYEASTPFAVKKSIKAKLVIFANSFRELYRDRSGIARDGTGSETDVIYKYLDLALRTGDDETFAYQRGGGVNPQENETAIYDAEKLNFRLKVVVGYANPSANPDPNSGVGTSIFGSGLLNAVYDSYVTLNLTPTIHDFNIDDLGRVTFTLNYLAYVEDFFDQPVYNIFANPETTISQIKRRIEYSELNAKCETAGAAALKDDPEQIKVIENEKKTNLRFLMDKMLEEKKIRILDMNINELNDYRAGGPLLDIDSEVLQGFFDKLADIAKGGDIYDQIVDEAIDVPEKKRYDASDIGGAGDFGTTAVGTSINRSVSELESAEAPLTTFGNVPFFWVSDLIDVILKYQTELFRAMPAKLAEELQDVDASIKNEQISAYQRYAENHQRYRILLGPVELIKNTKDGIETSIVSLGDLPVSVKYFMEFMTEKMLKTDRQDFPLGSFLNQFFNSFINDYLNSDKCYGGRSKQKVRMFNTALTAFNEYPTIAPDDLTYYMTQTNNRRVDLSSGVVKQPALDIMGGRGEATITGDISTETNYLVFYAGRVQPSEMQEGNREQDHSRGIWHYQIGQDSGITKTINLSKTNSPGLAEVRYEQEGYDGLQQLRVTYDATIKTYLDVTAVPGSYIYIEPRGFDTGIEDPRLFTTLGVGGYYMIIRSEHSMGPGRRETTITAKWVAQIEADALEDSPVVPGATDPAACSKVRGERALNKDLATSAEKGFSFDVSDIVSKAADIVKDDGSTGEPSDVPGTEE